MTQPQIVDGPNKYELMLALFDRTCDRQRPVTFKVVRREGYSPVEVTVHILSVGIEDGSGESWLIECQASGSTQNYSGYYSTKSRKGVLKLGLHHS